MTCRVAAGQTLTQRLAKKLESKQNQNRNIRRLELVPSSSWRLISAWRPKKKTKQQSKKAKGVTSWSLKQQLRAGLRKLWPITHLNPAQCRWSTCTDQNSGNVCQQLNRYNQSSRCVFSSFFFSLSKLVFMPTYMRQFGHCSWPGGGCTGYNPFAFIVARQQL